MPFQKIGTRLVSTDSSGRVIWASDLPPGALLPGGNTITLTNKVVSFPDFAKNNWAYWTYATKGTFISGAAWTWASIVPGETTLAQELVGAVPAGTNYLDVRATISQTKAPSTFLYSPVELWVPTGNESWGVGQGFVLEATQAWRRGFYFALENGNVYLRRFQSVQAVSGVGGVTSPQGVSIKADPQVWTGGANVDWRKKWTHGGVSNAWLAYQLGANTNTTSGQRGGPEQPSLTDTTDYSSQYNCQITIRPGYIPA